MEKKTKYIIFIIGGVVLIIGIVVTVVLLSLSGDDGKKKEDWEAYDSYIFSIFWPPSSCYNKWSGNEKCFKRLDNLTLNNNFIIHGLWPSYLSGELLENCNKGEEINISFDDELYKKDLIEKWPGLYSGDQKLWNHEYNKHGYCYIQRIEKEPKTEYKKYFDKSLEMFEGYRDLMEEILPDTPKGLHNITKEKFKKFINDSSLDLNSSSYSLICERNDSKKYDILYEIRFGYDFNMSRNNEMKSEENCPDNFQIYFSNDTKKAVYEKYDFYVLSFLWNPSTCKIKGKECYKKVKNSDLNILMIHGLWPSFKNGPIPQWCNLVENIPIDNLPEELHTNMTKYWIGTYTNNEDFWVHEYNKHGYCYNQRIKEDIMNYPIYFQKTMDLYHYFNVKDLMKEFYPGILVGDRKLNKTSLKKKLDEKFGENTYFLSCLEYENKFYLNEVLLKLDLDFNLITIKRDDLCPEEIYAEFLEVEGPQKQHIGLYYSYNMYFFTILWLPTTCQMKGEICYENIKVIPKNAFTIHGLWPNFKNGSLPDWCNGPNDIEIEFHDKEMLEFMSTHSISGYHTNPYFWGHEYNKHGYCYNQRNMVDTKNYEFYFQKTKELYLKYDFANIFLNIYKDKIQPGDMQISRQEVENYLYKKGIPKNTYVIVCKNIAYTNVTEVDPHIYEIRFRFDLNFKLAKNETDHSEFDCPEIFYAQFL